MKPTIYLAGPITRCSDKEISNWRESIKEKYSGEFDFKDPSKDRKILYKA